MTHSPGWIAAVWWRISNSASHGSKRLAPSSLDRLHGSLTCLLTVLHVDHVGFLETLLDLSDVGSGILFGLVLESFEFSLESVGASREFLSGACESTVVDGDGGGGDTGEKSKGCEFHFYLFNI